MGNEDISKLNLQADEQLICKGEIRSLEKEKGITFLTSKRLITQKPNAEIIIKLENIKRVFTAKKGDIKKGFVGRKVRVVCIALNDKHSLCFIPILKFSKTDNLVMAANAFSGVYTNTLPMQIRLAEAWVTKIQNAIRDKEIADLKTSVFIKAWKCEYCVTLNEAENEKCSNCGSPRRG